MCVTVSLLGPVGLQDSQWVVCICMWAGAGLGGWVCVLSACIDFEPMLFLRSNDPGIFHILLYGFPDLDDKLREKNI